MKLSAGTGGNICPFVLGLRGDFCDGLKRPEVVFIYYLTFAYAQLIKQCVDQVPRPSIYFT